VARVEAEPDPKEPMPRIPRPVPGGTESIESLGRFIDDVLMGHARTQRRIARDMEDHLLTDEESPEDPPPSEVPPPVPGGDQPLR